MKIFEIHPPLRKKLGDYPKSLEYLKVLEEVLEKYISYEFEILLDIRNAE